MFAESPYSATSTSTNYNPTATTSTFVVVISQAATATSGYGPDPAYDPYWPDSERTSTRAKRRVQGLPDGARVVGALPPATRPPVMRLSAPMRPHRVQHRAA